MNSCSVALRATVTGSRSLWIAKQKTETYASFPPLPSILHDPFSRGDWECGPDPYSVLYTQGRLAAHPKHQERDSEAGFPRWGEGRKLGLVNL